MFRYLYFEYKPRRKTVHNIPEHRQASNNQMLTSGTHFQETQSFSLPLSIILPFIIIRVPNESSLIPPGLNLNERARRIVCWK